MVGIGKVIFVVFDRVLEIKIIYRECNVDCYFDVIVLNLCLFLDFLLFVRVGCDIKISIFIRLIM